jgi:glyoxylase-like metal-dependent hydrolase (beta-lactamase superfamily II)
MGKTTSGLLPRGLSCILLASASMLGIAADPAQVRRFGIAGSNAWLIETERAVYAVDAGWPGNEGRMLRQIEATGKPLKTIFLTHSHLDHFGSAGRLRELSGCLIAINADDFGYLARAETPIEKTNFLGFWGRALLPLAEAVYRPAPLAADLVLRDGDRLTLDGAEALVIATPGHTPGSSCLLVGRKLFVGDLLSTLFGLHAQFMYAMDWREIDESVRKLLVYDFDEIYAGHGERVGTRAELIAIVNK